LPFLVQAVDQLVRRCGSKVHNRVGKFRFLNQLVKLITPKYLGAQTSPEVITFYSCYVYNCKEHHMKEGHLYVKWKAFSRKSESHKYITILATIPSKKENALTYAYVPHTHRSRTTHASQRHRSRTTSTLQTNSLRTNLNVFISGQTANKNAKRRFFRAIFVTETVNFRRK
uniref:VHS domain-containing protein n=1 Tax=Angiostrongylus cantonensis TaxID=6313 RepID=A0A0K0D8L4_ANGCA